ncbi:acyl-CoA N-acyltransferase [Aspergillus keveii]|uniref:Acyl-CoA N-acyltransferase n=1 Tax=Aspergillus keveii TaxID=714993 RepID=A0ABR4G862_9EURO
MSLAILPALLPDLPQIHDVYFLAFKDEPILDILYPTGIADRKAYDQGIAQYRHVDRAGYVIKCVDASTGAVIGMAQWDVFWHPDAETEGWTRPGDIPWLEGKDKERCLGFLGRLWDIREGYFGGRRHVFLSHIAVHPSHQRRGAGRLLVQWGMDLADQLRIPAYAEASKSGHALYKKMGWECLRHEKIEISNNNGDDSMKEIDIPLMVYMPRAAGGVRFEEWVRRGYAEF